MAAIMITRAQLHDALAAWCEHWCYGGVPAHLIHSSLVQFCQGSLVPQESDIPTTAATHFQNNVAAARLDLLTRLTAINFSATDKAQNMERCNAWAAQRKHQIEEVHALITDLTNWNATTYRGSKAILNTLKLVRALSRTV